MPIAHIRSSLPRLTANNNVPTLTYELPSVPAIGTLIVVPFFGFAGGGGPGAITVESNRAGTFTNYSQSGSSNWRCGVAYLIVPAGWVAPVIITVRAANAYSWLGFPVSEYSGAITTADPLDGIPVFAAAAGTLTSLQIVGTAGTQADGLVVSGVAVEEYDGNANINTPAGFTSRGVNQDWAVGTPFRSVDKITSAATAETLTFAFDSASIAVGFQARFKAFTGAGAPITISGGGQLPWGNQGPPLVTWGSAPAVTANAGDQFVISAGAVDDLGVSGIVLRRDGVSVATGVGDSVSLTGNYPSGGAIVWEVEATDSNNQPSKISATTTVLGDTTAPTVSLSASIDIVTSVNQQPFLTATVSDNVGVSRVEFYRNSIGLTGLVGTTTSLPHRIVLAFSSADNGVIPFIARAYDQAGNFSNSTEVNITVAINTGYIATLAIGSQTAEPGDTVEWVIRVTESGVPVAGVPVTAVTANPAVFDFDDATADFSIPGFGVVDPTQFHFGGDTLAFELLQSGLATDNNGEVRFLGTVNPSAINGQSTTVTFSSLSGFSVSGTISVATQSGWVTVYRDQSSWIQVQRDEL